MTTATANTDSLAEVLEALRREVAQLSARVAVLENGATSKPARVPAAPADEPISPEDPRGH